MIFSLGTTSGFYTFSPERLPPFFPGLHWQLLAGRQVFRTKAVFCVFVRPKVLCLPDHTRVEACNVFRANRLQCIVIECRLLKKTPCGQAMSEDQSDQRLSQMSTAWTMLFQAHDGSAEDAKAARRELLQRYGDPVYRYLLASLRDADAAEELYQEFALKFVRGDFKRAHPDRGRFRDFLKTVLYHLIVDFHKRRNRQPRPLIAESELLAASDGPAEPEAAFVEAWRSELLTRAWEALARFEQETGQPLATVLRLRTDHPELRSPELAERLSRQLGRHVTDGWVRKRLHFARERFTSIILEEVRLTLGSTDADALAEELRDLGLFDYCKNHLT
jgi:RNA polymerase sigma factor (sigma-70 family)